MEHGAPKVAHLSVNQSLDGSVQARVSQALREAARAFEAAANAILGDGAACVPHSLSLPEPDAFPLVQTINDFIRAKARADRSDRYLRQLRVSLSDFAAGRGNVPVARISVGDVEEWLGSKARAPKTKRGYLADVRTLFNYALRRGLVRHNPASAVELPALKGDEPPGIHTPEEVRKVLETARRMDLDVCRHLAVRYFAGVRSSEAHRLREEDILGDRGVIQVPARKSKTRSRRLVTIQPCLSAWLALGGELRAVGDMTIRAIVRASKVPWKRNVTRHSFVSYHLAHSESAAKTALEAGHSEQMLFSHYRALVTAADAEAFWGIIPA